MEVDTRNTEDGPTALSSPTVDQVDISSDKVNGDDDLGFTITMNESDDEASNDTSSSGPLKKVDDKPASPVKVNGKPALDDDSQSSASNDTKDCPEQKATKESDGEQGGSEVKDVLSNGTAHSKGQEASLEAVEEATSAEQSENSSKKEVENQKDSDSELCSLKDKDRDDEKEAADSTAKKKTLPDKQRVEEEDSDVVEVEDSPMKSDKSKKDGRDRPQPAKNKPSPPTIKDSKSRMVPVVASSTGSMVLDARTAASMSFLASTPPGASLVPSSSGVQLMLPQAAAGVQGSPVVFVPNSSSYLGSVTSASLHLPTMGAPPIQSRNPARNTAPFLFSQFPQYANMMSSQGNQFVVPSQNQGVRPNIGMPPVLANMPEKPTSSVGMIDMIRWEVENHINIKPKYNKPNPKAELGNMAKWVFDLGSDMVKEFVYHDLVRIQHRRKDEGNLSAKEKDDFAKLQEIDKDLNHKVGHLKYKLTKSCKCGFKTELDSVLYNHQQHAHIERGGFLNCALCKFSTRQPNAFRFHMETEHGRVGKMENRPSFYECPLCPYETNYTNRLDQHKVRCQRQFREAFNLHPSCMTGPEVSLCLENVFYFVFTRQFMNSILPKPSTPAVPPVSSSTKIRDMPTKAGMAPVNPVQTKKMGGAATMLATSNKQIAPRMGPQFSPRVGKQQPQPNSALSRNFPVISSKINTQTNRFPNYSGGPQRPSAPNNQSLLGQPPVPNQPNSGFEVCEICGGYVKDRKALRIHFFYAHRIDMPFGVFERPQPPLYCATCFARFWTAQGLQKHIEIHKNDMVNTTQTSNGVAGKCISCGHRVPNILMHMRMVHNRELRHYLAALMCIFCGNRFSTKREVENHMGKMHGVIVKNSSVQGSVVQSKPATQAKSSPVPYPGNVPSVKPPAKAPVPKPASGGKMNRSSQCVLCNLSFSRNVDLTRHCMRVHHTCMKCGLVVVDKESLSRHTCLHSASGMRSCQICKENGFHPAYYIKHMRDKHLRKCSVVLRRIDRAVVETLKRPITISDSEDDEPAPKLSEPKRQKTGEENDIRKDKMEVDCGSRKAEGEEKGPVEKKEGGNEERKEQIAGGNAIEKEMEHIEEESEKMGKGEGLHQENVERTEKEAGAGMGEGKDKEGSGESENKAAPFQKDIIQKEMQEVSGKDEEEDKEGSDKMGNKKTEQDEEAVKEDQPSHSEVQIDEPDMADSSRNEDDDEDQKKGAGSESEDTGSKSRDTPDRSTKRMLRSQGDEDTDKVENSEQLGLADDKSDEEDLAQKENSDKSDEVPRKKRKLDKSDSGEDGSVRKSLRRSGSKGSDVIELDWIVSFT